jgi:hypothetical protein
MFAGSLHCPRQTCLTRDGRSEIEGRDVGEGSSRGTCNGQLTCRPIPALEGHYETSHRRQFLHLAAAAQELASTT